MEMKKYNRPVVEIKGFEVEDIIATSVFFGGDQEMQAVYNDFVSQNGGTVDYNDQAVVFQW